MRNMIGFFVRIRSFDTVTLHTSGMRHSSVYEVVMNNGEAEISQYAAGFRDGKKTRHLVRRAVCSAERALKLMNKCRLLSWDGFHGKHPRGIKDGTKFSLDAMINGRKIRADGSQNFPWGYRNFTQGLYEILEGGKNERV